MPSLEFETTRVRAWVSGRSRPRACGSGPTIFNSILEDNLAVALPGGTPTGLQGQHEHSSLFHDAAHVTVHSRRREVSFSRGLYFSIFYFKP